MVYKGQMKCFLLLIQFYCTFLLAKFYCVFLLTQFCYQLFLHIFLLINELLFFKLTLTIIRIPNKLSHVLLTKHSHLHLSLFHFCLLLQIIGSNLYTYIYNFHPILFVLSCFAMTLDQTLLQ